MLLPSLFALALATTAAGQTRPKPVVMPFGLRYGQHTFGAWFGIPVTVGDQQFDLSISTSLSQSWVPGKSMCSSDSNVTRCTEEMGGTFDSGKSWTADDSQKGVAVGDELLKGFYNKTIGAQLEVQVGDGKKLLAMEGVGDVGTDTITLASDTGSFKMSGQPVGVINSGNREFMANGYLSLQQMALSLYSNQFTPSPSFHLFHGLPSYTNYTELDLSSRDYGAYSLIFGGYDSAILDLNTTQQYPLIETTFSTLATNTTPYAADAALPASETVSYGMQVMLEDIVYRWTIGGKTDNSLLAAPKLAIIDSTTPWVWLPKSAFDTVISISGAVWNETYDAYTIPYCMGWDECTPTQENAASASLDFLFSQMDGDKLTLRFSDYMYVRYLPSNDTSVYMVPIKELPEDAPIILGRPFLSGVHLWVDYAEKYWGMAQSNLTLQYITTSKVVPWDRTSHPLITNTSILVERPANDGATTNADGTSSGSSASGSSSTDDPKKRPGIGMIAGIAGGGAALLALAVTAFCLIRRKKRTAGKTNYPHRPESMIELHSSDGQKLSELPPNPGTQFRPHELPPNQAQFGKQFHEVQQNQGGFGKPQEMPVGHYNKPQELASYQVPPPPPGPPPPQQQQGLGLPQQTPYTPVSPVGPQTFQYPPPQGGIYPPPPAYGGGPGGPIYYEMDASGTRGY